jgi:hypothetical protein
MGKIKCFESEVEVSIEDWDDEDLIQEIKDRGYEVSGGDDYEKILDDIFELHKEWMEDKGDRDNRFEKAIRNFFAKHLNKVKA